MPWCSSAIAVAQPGACPAGELRFQLEESRLAFSTADHFLVPKHVLLSQEQAEQLLKKYGLSIEQLPKMLKTDPAVKDLKPEKNDVVKIVRDSPTAGKTVYYRRVA